MWCKNHKCSVPRINCNLKNTNFAGKHFSNVHSFYNLLGPDFINFRRLCIFKFLTWILHFLRFLNREYFKTFRDFVTNWGSNLKRKKRKNQVCQKAEVHWSYFVEAARFWDRENFGILNFVWKHAKRKFEKLPETYLLKLFGPSW